MLCNRMEDFKNIKKTFTNFAALIPRISVGASTGMCLRSSSSGRKFRPTSLNLTRRNRGFGRELRDDVSWDFARDRENVCVIIL